MMNHMGNNMISILAEHSPKTETLVVECSCGKTAKVCGDHSLKNRQIQRTYFPNWKINMVNTKGPNKCPECQLKVRSK